jgi:hypothetical protein
VDELIRQLAQYGMPGLITAIALWIAYRKDQKVEQLYEAMLALSEKSNERYHGAIIETTKTVSALAKRPDDHHTGG